jgi:hypothetical protein
MTFGMFSTGLYTYLGIIYSRYCRGSATRTDLSGRTRLNLARFDIAFADLQGWNLII